MSNGIDWIQRIGAVLKNHKNLISVQANPLPLSHLQQVFTLKQNFSAPDFTWWIDQVKYGFAGYGFSAPAFSDQRSDRAGKG